jgi:DHA1 family bicyclomycin/chloramphenicol resistance-like MFS transporter
VIEAGRVRTERSVIAFLAFIGILMAFGIDAALPAFDQLSDTFDLDGRGISPAITGTVYFGGMAFGQLFYGILADRFGRQPILVTGIAVYAVGAMASALSPNLEALLVTRFVWGLGAAAPTVMRMAIARDLFAGDQMARVVSTFSAIFLLGPIFMPFVGEAILLAGDWRLVFASGLVLAGVTLAWTLAFGETLAPDLRRPIRLAPIRDAFGAVVRTRVTFWILIAQAFFGGAFFVWLGSAQPVIDEIYGRDSQFTLFFGASGIGMALALLFNRRLIEKFGAETMVIRAASVFVVACIGGLVGTLLADGVPSVWFWFGWALVANAMGMIMGPMSASLALEPMADKAGTAAAILGVAQLGVGAALAAIVDAQIGTTVTPMVLGALVYGSLGLGCLVMALRPSAVHPSAVRPTKPSAAL